MFNGKKFKLQKISKKNEKVKTVALRLIDGKDVKCVISYSKAINKKGWVDDKSKKVKFGYLKSKQFIFMARAFIVGNHKFSLLTATTK